jgi:hypothetical protein
MDDLIKSVKAQLYDRVSSPLLASFLISWLAWNHRMLLVLVSSEFKLVQKFDYVDKVLYPGAYQVICQGFLWPLLSALVLLVIYPIPGRWIYEHVRKEQKVLKEIQQRIEDETPITQEEAHELRLIIRNAAREHDKQIRERDEEISSLKKELAETKTVPVAPSTLSPSEPAPGPPSIKTSDSQTLMLHAIASKDNIADWELRHKFQAGENLAKYMHNLDRLQEQGLIESFLDDGTERYRSLPLGRAHLVARQALTELL